MLGTGNFPLVLGGVVGGWVDLLELKFRLKIEDHPSQPQCDPLTD